MKKKKYRLVLKPSKNGSSAKGVIQKLVERTIEKALTETNPAR
ncbi:hypothetical protein [Mesobacillus subterraneus]|nr:hypothetical protein [Mesobacillus subterraneus]